MKKIFIVGAGSAGCHLAHAAHVLGYETIVSDIDENALERFGTLWRERYRFPYEGHFLIQPSKPIEADYYIVATPPDTHLQVVKWIVENVSHVPKILVEKPLCLPHELEEFDSIEADIQVNYNHNFSPIWSYLDQNPTDIKVSWLEDASHIMNAHPWLKSGEGYLFDYKRGGGSAMEHSHGLAAALSLAQLQTDISQYEIEDAHFLGEEYDNFSSIKIRMNNVLILSETSFTYPTTIKQVVTKEEAREIFIFDNQYHDTYQSAKDDIPFMQELTVCKTRALEFIHGLDAVLGMWQGRGYCDSYEVAKNVVKIIGEAYEQSV